MFQRIEYFSTLTIYFFKISHDMDYAEVDMKWYITETYQDAHRVNCLQSGNLMYCETKDVECDPLEYESSLER